MKKKMLVAGLALLGMSAVAASSALAAGASITSGRIALGVNEEGHLNVSGTGVAPVNSGGVLGVSYQFDDGAWRDATAPGCLCEGWGVSGGGVSGYANVDTDGGAHNLTVDAFTPTPTSITSSVHLTSFADLAVTQVYAASAKAPGALFENKVTITNTGASTITDVRYVRVMDWDVPMTEFNEFVTIKGTATTSLLERSHNNGFDTANPLGGIGAITPATVNADFNDLGSFDHGAYFKFNFGELEAGESYAFSIFYGAAANEREMLAALGAVGIELYSLGQSNVGGGAYNDGVTYAFGFKGVGGEIIVPPVPEPATMLLFGTGLAGLAALGRRKRD